MAKRPSRLLNLNKSTPTQKMITATNAAISPLLRLPPEIRSRIFDFVFGGNVIHICGKQECKESCSRLCSEKRDYVLTVCGCPEHHVLSPPRLSLNILPPKDLGRHNRYQRNHMEHHCGAAFGRHIFSLDVLCVSRQVYQEAVLKPFTQTVFNQLTEDSSYFAGLRSFLRNLIPSQAKAITRMQMYCDGDYSIAESTIKRMRGLKHLDILFEPCPWLDRIPNFLPALRSLGDQHGFKALVKFSLQSACSVKITVAFQFHHFDLFRWRNESGSDAIKQWAHDMETELLATTMDDSTGLT